MQAMCGFRRRAPNASAAGDSCQGQARGACDRPPPPWAARLVFLTPLASTWCFMKQHRERRKAAVHHSSPSSVETGDAMPISLYFVALRRLRDAGGRGAFYRGPRASSFTDCTADRQTTFSPHLLFLCVLPSSPFIKLTTLLRAAFETQDDTFVLAHSFFILLFCCRYFGQGLRFVGPAIPSLNCPSPRHCAYRVALGSTSLSLRHLLRRVKF